MDTQKAFDTYQRYVGNVRPIDFVKPHQYSTEDAVYGFCKTLDDCPEDVAELLEIYLDANLPCLAERWLERVKNFEQEGFEYLEHWAEKNVKYATCWDGKLTFDDGSQLWHDSGFGWLLKETTDSNTAMMVN